MLHDCFVYPASELVGPESRAIVVHWFLTFDRNECTVGGTPCSANDSECPCAKSRIHSIRLSGDHELPAVNEFDTTFGSPMSRKSSQCIYAP